MAYQPSPALLEAYANVLVNFALGSGKGITKGDSVLVQLPECAKPLYVALRNTILKSGGNPVMQFAADNVQPADVYSLSTADQLTYFPEHYYKGITEQFDHRIAIISEADKYELQGVDAKLILARANAILPYREWLNEKEAKGLYTWTIAMYGTAAMAADVGMSEEEYWQQISAACYLQEEDPIAHWCQTSAELEQIKSALNALEIDKVHVEAEGINLTVGLGANRTWLGGSGRNIPSFELFISPDWRQTEGVIRFNQPLYRYGNVLEDIELSFKEGEVIKATASKNQDLLREMIATENADKIGEFSLTDSRHSRITHIMGETLFDENIGGPQGNTHIALGNAYQDSYPGNAAVITNDQWQSWGYNRSAVHTDIISTAQRKVTATLKDGSTRIIYQDGQFKV